MVGERVGMKQQNSALHKKRFGQYFSGKQVADMLFSLLPKEQDWTTVVDPMAGIGDMLVSVRDHTGNHPQLLGIEIDSGVARECASRLPEAKVHCSDAFKSIDLVTAEGFDLVITNPPYVRYQLQSEDDDVMPSAQEIRANLIQQIEKLPYLSEAEKRLLLNLSKNYSGLADMAVPAWLLCAALVRKDGYLAVVVPETWLSRDYAAPIQYLLQKCFTIETIARDTNASWFTDALVKTCLVVAKRTEIQPLSESGKSITRVIETDREYTQRTATLFPHLIGVKGANRWCAPEDKTLLFRSVEIPYELSEVIGSISSIEYTSLFKMGIECGQGLRTGANDFFYVGLVRDEGESIIVCSKTWDQGGKEYRFSKKDIIPALQNRGEIEGLVVSAGRLLTGVVYPQGAIYGELSDYIASAENYRDARGRRFKDFSAVAPNEKKTGDRIVREWFRLPQMMDRHLPNLCITRVSAKIPECLYVEQTIETPIAIDANMVTLWGEDVRMVIATLAMLNSTWSKLSLELICTVMGGGALKVEASHIRKLLLPKCSEEQFEALEKAGETLITEGHMTNAIQDKIDDIMTCAFRDQAVIQRMRDLLNRKYKERSTRL
jgi:hypothetical protein